MRLHVGTSGYAYKEWKGKFYPAKHPASEMLPFYAERFATVEINSTFFRMPSEDTLRQWAEVVPANFTFAFKAPQVITHRKRLRDVEDPTGYFLRTIATLGNRLGPVLVQLPPNFKKDVPRLEAFLDILPADARIAFGFRNPSWFDEDVVDLLRTRGRPLCVEEDLEGSTPFISTADWGYLRLRRGAYDEADLRAWAERIRAESWTDVYVYFMHEDTATGPGFAVAFAEIFQNGSESR